MRLSTSLHHAGLGWLRSACLLAAVGVVALVVPPVGRTEMDLNHVETFVAPIREDSIPLAWGELLPAPDRIAHPNKWGTILLYEEMTVVAHT